MTEEYLIYTGLSLVNNQNKHHTRIRKKGKNLRFSEECLWRQWLKNSDLKFSVASSGLNIIRYFSYIFIHFIFNINANDASIDFWSWLGHSQTSAEIARYIVSSEPWVGSGAKHFISNDIEPMINMELWSNSSIISSINWGMGELSTLFILIQLHT